MVASLAGRKGEKTVVWWEKPMAASSVPRSADSMGTSSSVGSNPVSRDSWWKSLSHALWVLASDLSNAMHIVHHGNNLYHWLGAVSLLKCDNCANMQWNRQ